MPATWKDHARTVILAAIAEATAQGLSNEATVKLVDSRYPFGERKHHPYKQWLAARRELLFGGKSSTNVSNGVAAKLAAWNSGQPIAATKDNTRQDI